MDSSCGLPDPDRPNKTACLVCILAPWDAEDGQ